ncbi:hypothetical protein QFZ65_001845 [Arthrobacter sp. B3I9]|uniref:hypothetical protein n=1 Tax=Arthrobacter sp. B3I9 TaxID=3042270 RepID=UPI0027914A22|nr:hypothetical protein [Arthrobacter sp. B3I9]MDQ0849907.1 hypothetical protein [Arthrobacter sp. B3I9]
MTWNWTLMTSAYRDDRDAEENGEWVTAVRGYMLVNDDPAYPEAADRRTVCQVRQKALELQDELLLHAESGNWKAVLDIGEELRTLDPAAAGPEGRTTHAQLELLYARARRADNAGKVQTARRLMYKRVRPPQ